MRLLLDAGALIAVERADRETARAITVARSRNAELVTVAPVVGQVWRDGARQVRLARVLPLIDVVEVGLSDAQAAGELLRRTGGSDVVDALVALTALPGDRLLTSDPDDLGALVHARAVAATVVRV